MSSVSGKGQLAAGSDSPKPKVSVQAVAIRDTPASKALSTLRPGLLLALLAARFSAVVADPVAELQIGLAVVAALQITYAVVCLPPAGSQNAKPTRKPRPGERKKQDAGPNLIVTTVLSLVLTAIATAGVHVAFILFGAPFLDHIPHTLLCAAHFSLVALFPIFYARGVDGDALLALAGVYAPLDETFGGLLGALLGAWLGAVPIPLDWDREWQKWPVTIIAGMYIGHALGKLAGTVLFGKSFAPSSHAEEEE